MDRRTFFKIAASTGVALSTPWWARRARASADSWGGPFWVTVHAAGGWDPTLLCDPKGNATADSTSPINDYLTSEILDIGPFRVAPVDGHQTFFERFQDRLLVINGVDAQTVSHESGTRHTWSGSTDPNVPAINALTAAAADVSPSMAYISNGGYDQTGGLIAATRIPDPDDIYDLAYPDRLDSDDADSTLLTPSMHDRVQAARDARLARLLQSTSLPREARAMEMLERARGGDNQLAVLASYLPDDLDNSGNPLIAQAEVACAAFRAGVSVSANLEIGGFDTHGDHDEDHRSAMVDFIAGITFLMDEAERHGIADQIIVLMSSEFARTPWYNDTDGKDHWSVTSFMCMGPGITGGRVVGATTGDQHARKVNASSLALDDSGVTINPAYIHASLRDLAGITDNPLAAPWPVGPSLPLF